MNKFLKIAKEIGWEQIEENILVFRSRDKDKNGYYSINFVTCSSYDNFDLNDERISKDFVKNYIMKICCSNKCKEENLNWVEPLIISDYFAHRLDYEKELIWAKKAMKENPKLNIEQFSKQIRTEL